MDYSAFDNTLTLRDIAGNHIRFLVSSFDEKYLVPIPSNIPDGMLPPEDFEVRNALVGVRFYTERIGDVGFIATLFRTEKYRVAKALAEGNINQLKKLTSTSRAHSAALKRIINDMPAGNGFKEFLLKNFEKEN